MPGFQEAFTALRQMSHTTRCPACATMFKVADNQLKVAQGWVRCGQCGEVFEASLHLLADGGGELQAKPQARQTARALSPPAPLAPTPPAEPTAARAAREDAHPLSSPVEKPAIHVPAPVVAGPVEPLAASGHGEGRQEPAFSPIGFVFKRSGSQPQDTVPVRQDASAPQDAQVFPELAFVREARRKDFWRTPLVRILLGAISLVLALALMLQWVVRQKDMLAAHEPRLAPLIQAICRPLGCEVRPLRRIESLVIENSSFSRTDPDAYRLSFTFKNTENVALEVPALEITLTDNQDQVVLRRVVLPVDFGATAPTLAAYSKFAGALTLKVAAAGSQGAASPSQTDFVPVFGYRIVAFYP